MKSGVIEEVSAKQATDKARDGSSQRFEELDSLRGLASFSVVLYHFARALSIATYQKISHSPLRIAVIGPEAVILFFLLSGFVLVLPYTRRRELGYGRFLIKRICRIYLPYLAALALAVSLNYKFHGLHTDNGWANLTWYKQASGRDILDHVLFLGNYQWALLNTAFWSLVYEMRISLIFPFLAILIVKVRDRWMWAFAAILSVVAKPLCGAVYGLLHFDTTADGFVQTSLTLHYAALFIVGALIAKNRGFLGEKYKQLSSKAIVLISVVAIFFYTCSSGVRYKIPAPFLFPNDIGDWGCALGASAIILLALYCKPFQQFLHHRWMMHLGAVSYSLYLVHGSVLFAMLYLNGGHLTMWLLPVYLLATVCLTEVFYVCIERPTMALGRFLGKRPNARLPLVREIQGS
jgi:peptidoglycan/LPS O-acetylase OafA/YrhL